MNAEEIADEIIREIQYEPTSTDRLRDAIVQVVRKELFRRDCETEQLKEQNATLLKKVEDLGGIVGDF